MSKEQTTVFKGIAILMMLFFHLFGGAGIEQWREPLLYVGDKPLVSYLARASYPVSFFLIFTGYGLAFTYRQGCLSFSAQWRRVMRLYVLYWVVSVVFASIGTVVNPDRYPGSWLHVVANVTALHCTYNGEAWFLFPYMLLCLSSPWLVRGLMAIRKLHQALLVIAIYAVCFIAVKHLVVLDTFWYPLLLQPFFFVTLFFYFALGVMLYRWIEKRGSAKLFSSVSSETSLAKVSPSKTNLLSLVTCFMLLVLIAVKSCFKVTLADGLYALAVIVLLLQLSWKGGVARVLRQIGKHTAAMWLTHTYFAVYLFPDFFHAPCYPILIFLLLVAVTWLVAFPLERISQFICSYFLPTHKK